jgi:HK97 family phage major capsid protein
MTDNRNLPVHVLKADMALSDLTSGGKLVADQWKNFYLIAIKGQVVQSQIRNVRLTRETTEINKMDTFGTQVLHPGTESQALTLAQRVAPHFHKVTITSQEVVCQVDYPRYVLMDQIEGPGFKNTLITYLGLHVKRDFENLVINGDATTPSTNTLLAMFDGMLIDATTNVYAAAGALSSVILGNTKKTMPSEYRQQPNLVYFTNEYACDDLSAEYEGRGTPVGDTALINGMPLKFRGRPVVEVPLFPSTLGVGHDTRILYMDPKQFIFGLHETLELESEYNIRERTWTVVLTARLGQVYNHEPSVVLTTGVTGSV